MTESQIKALASLERAFKKCREARIVFYVAYDNLLAFDRDEWEDAPKEGLLDQRFKQLDEQDRSRGVKHSQIIGGDF